MLPFSVNLRPGTAVSEQLLAAFHRALANGQLRDGDAFPSVRAISRDLKISPTTAHKVVTHLKDRGFLVSLPGIGMQVVAPDLAPAAERLALLEPAAADLLRRAEELSLSATDLATLLENLEQSKSDTT
ncbi:MAG: GntR family transcriptional regulator [Verrucomicrobiota bacterium]